MVLAIYVLLAFACLLVFLTHFLAIHGHTYFPTEAFILYGAIVTAFAVPFAAAYAVPGFRELFPVPARWRRLQAGRAAVLAVYAVCAGHFLWELYHSDL